MRAHTCVVLVAIRILLGRAMWISWPNSPPKSNPFPMSIDITGWEYLNNTQGIYGNADTWYPSWGADNRLYSPWTDGHVKNISSGSGGKPRQGYNSTTGFAVIEGDDPLNLNLVYVSNFVSSTFPYGGRYPCGSLYYKGIWYYGTYALDNYNSKVNPPPDCHNWCVQGPFVGYRYSKDSGRSWIEPRLRMKDDRDNIFHETCKNNVKVKFGAPHVVDFGEELEHSPDGRMYIVGHGASRPTAHQSWMQGDEVYIARTASEPNPTSINELSFWEFWNGKTWIAGDVSQARPIISWLNHTGVVTMTYFPVLKKYITSISTPTFAPDTTKPFDTYFLESDMITGPFRMVSYLREFGVEAYFVNHPSKFLGTSVEGGYYETVLSYSANFADHSKSVPVGSGYHWSLQKARFKL